MFSIVSALLHGRQNVFLSLKVVLAMLVLWRVDPPCLFLRGTDGQNVFSSLKIVLAMLVFVERRSALPFLRGTDGQNVFSSLKVVLAMLVFVESKRVGGQKVRSRVL
jgi:hypothetical protein